MSHEGVMLSDRELAVAFWLAGAVALTLWKPELRQSAIRIVGMLLRPVLLVPILLFAAWIMGVVSVASGLGTWQPDMLKDTLLWAFPGLILLFGAVEAPRQREFYRRRVRQALGLAALIAFYLNLATLDLIWEVILQPVIFVATAVSTLADHRPEFRRARPVANLVLILLFFVLLAPPTIRLIADSDSLDLVATLRAFLLPVWLTLFALPFIFALSVILSYDLAFRRATASVGGRSVPWHAKMALFLGFGLDLRSVSRLVWPRGRELVQTATLRDARRVVVELRSDLRAEDATKRKAVEDLERFAGVAGTDDRGRRLDRREFKETTEALNLLANSHMGWFRRDGRYQSDLLERVGGILFRSLLPEVHGITMRVSRSGVSWYAWRRTAPGWCFGVGATGPPPSQWFYEGSDPPKTFPSEAGGWSSDPGANWSN